jgi:hypothetical protein
MTFPRKAIWKTLTFRFRVKTTEFEVLADALAGELQESAQKIHGCVAVTQPTTRVNGRIVNFRQQFHKRLATLDPVEDASWVELFNEAKGMHYSDDRADAFAWHRMVKLYPRLAAFRGCRAGVAKETRVGL